MSDWRLKKKNKIITDGVFNYDGVEYKIHNNEDVLCVMRCKKEKEEEYDKYAKLIVNSLKIEER